MRMRRSVLRTTDTLHRERFHWPAGSRGSSAGPKHAKAGSGSIQFLRPTFTSLSGVWTCEPPPLLLRTIPGPPRVRYPSRNISNGATLLEACEQHSGNSRGDCHVAKSAGVGRSARSGSGGYEFHHANWKLIVLNYNECLHCPLLHPALNRLTDYLSGN